MNYLDYITSIFTDYEVVEEAHFNWDGETTTVVIKNLGGGMNYVDASVQPIQLTFYTTDTESMMSEVKLFTKAYTNVSFWDDLEYVMQSYSTPQVLSQFNNARLTSQIVVQGTLIISSNVSEIKTVTIDDEPYETTIRKITYTTVEDSDRKSTDYINDTDISRALLTFTCSMVNRNNKVCLKARRIRTGTLSKNTAFTVALTFSDNDIVETYSLKLHSFTIDSQNGTIPVANFEFIK